MPRYPSAPVELKSSLSPEELVMVLRTMLCQGALPTGRAAADTLAGEVSTDRVMLDTLPRAEDRAYFVTGQYSSMYRFEGRIIPSAGGSLLKGALWLRPFWHREVGMFLYGPAIVVGLVLPLTVVPAAVLAYAVGLPWVEAPGHAVSRLLDLLLLPVAGVLLALFAPWRIARFVLDREQLVLERLLARAVAAGESARP